MTSELQDTWIEKVSQLEKLDMGLAGNILSSSTVTVSVLLKHEEPDS